MPQPGPAQVGKTFRHVMVALTVCVALAFVLLFYPLYVIRPFRYQGARELAAALAVLRFRLPVEVVLGLASLLMVALSWRNIQGRVRRAAALFSAGLVVACGFASRINVYELMFHPLDRPSFSAAANAKLNGREEVITIRVGGQARAYTVRGMSYHHIVNDVVGGLPVVATY